MKRAKRTWLCALGIHRWLNLGATSLVCPWVGLYECLRCHKRQARYGYGTITADPPEGGWTDYLEMHVR